MNILKFSDPFHIIYSEKKNTSHFKLQFFESDIQNKLNTLRAYHFHPDRTNFFAKIWNIIFEYFIGKTAIQLHTDDENKSVYVKIDEICQKLFLDPLILQKEIKGKTPHEITAYLKTEALIKKMRELTSDFENNQIKETFHTLAKKGIQKENIAALLNQKEFPESKMAEALMELGTTLNTQNLSDQEFISEDNEFKPFRYTIQGSKILIWMKDQGYLKSINVKSLEINKIDLQLIKIKELAEKLNVKNCDSVHKISSIAERISYPTILELLKKMQNKDEKKILLNTLIQMGQELEGSNQTSKYFKQKKENSEIETFAFGIDDQQIYIAISKSLDGLIETGSFKQITLALKIDNFTDQSFWNQVSFFVRIKPNPEMIQVLGLQKTNENLINESNNLILNKDNLYIVDPYSFQDFSETGKIVFFQRKYDGDGEDLFEADIEFQLKFLIDIGYGLNSLHQMEYAHRDVKPSNFFYIGNLEDKSIPFEGKLADLGFLSKIGNIAGSGTILYLPPEALDVTNIENIQYKEGKVDISIDSYSYGVSILETILPRTKALQRFIQGEFDVPFFAEYTNEIDFQDNMDDFLELAKKEINKFKNSTIKKQILQVCFNLIRFDPKERILCHVAAKAIENILYGNFKEKSLPYNINHI
jgi:hypothetical protein